MSAVSFPKAPVFADPSERIVWAELIKQLPPDAAVICNLVILEPDKRFEIDFIVAIPEVGIAVLEVKGGEVTPNKNSTFRQKDTKGSRDIDPITQVTQNLYELKNFLGRKSSIKHFSPRPMLVFPYSDIPSSYSRPDVPRSIITDTVDLATIAGRIESNLQSQTFRPTAIEIRAMIITLGQTLDAQKSLMELGIEREDEVTALTEQQFKVLDLCKVMPRFQVLGAAGCGKTFVAIEQARRRTKAGEKVLFLCYNKGLSEYLKRRIAALPEAERPARVTTLHSLPNQWGVSIPSETYDDKFFDTELPAKLEEALAAIPSEDKFDVVIIDEAQDFHPGWWDVVIASLKDPAAGKIYAFGDIRQGIFRHAKDIPLELAPIHLDQNLRNSVPISELAALCVEDPLILAGLDGPPVTFIETTQALATTEADKIVERLLLDGWSPEDICLITTGIKHDKHKELAEGPKKVDYWNSFFDDEQVFYGHINGFKGLERRVIVLAINGFKLENVKKDMLYTGITRARDLLFIIGSKDDLRESGGKELVKKILGV